MRPSKPLMLATTGLFVWTRLVGLFAPAVAADDTRRGSKGVSGLLRPDSSETTSSLTVSDLRTP
jgi:hypothetical protein